MSENGWLGLVGIVGGVIVLVWMVYWIYRMKVLEREERRLMIERGITPPPPQPQGWPAVRARDQELRYQERRLLIEKGLEPGEDKAVRPFLHQIFEKDAPGPERYMRSGLIAIAIGLGLLAPEGILRWSGVPLSNDSRVFTLLLAMIGPVVTLYGAANLLYCGLTKNRPSEAASPSSQDSHSGS